MLAVRIPGGGASAARGIKRCSPKTRVLALSAHDDRETVLEMLEAGADGYLVKGSSIETILTSIERAARGQGSLSVEVTGGVIEELAGLLHARRRDEERSRRREERIRRALDDDLLHTVYQPICTLAGSTIGAEALARFRGPPRAARCAGSPRPTRSGCCTSSSWPPCARRWPPCRRCRITSSSRSTSRRRRSPRRGSWG